MTQTKPPLKTIQGLPTDVQVLKDNNGDLIQSDNAGLTTFMFSTSMDRTKTEDFYRLAMQEQSWRLYSTTSMETQFTTTLMYTKDKRMVMISFTRALEDMVTMVQIAIPKQPTKENAPVQQSTAGVAPVH